MKKSGLYVIAIAASCVIALNACGKTEKKTSAIETEHSANSESELAVEEDEDEDVVYDTYAPGEEPEEYEEEEETEPEEDPDEVKIPQTEASTAQKKARQSTEPDWPEELIREMEKADEDEISLSEEDVENSEDGPGGKATKIKKNKSGDRKKPDIQHEVVEPPLPESAAQ